MELAIPDTAPPADGVGLTSSYIQTMIREQVIRTVTSSTRPTGVEGCVIYETDTDLFYYYTGTAWAAFGGAGGSWTAPTLTNSWVNYGAGYATAGYRKSGDVVYLRGLLKSGTIGLSAFTLPTGYRPPNITYFSCATNGGAGTGYVDTAGLVVTVTGNNTFFGVEFQFSITT